jgi:hypothetical protein
MNDLETLDALFDAAEIAVDKAAFEQGTLTWSHIKLHDSTELMTMLRSAVQEGAQGWILFADRVVEPNGHWDDSWDGEHPLDGELALQDRSLRVTHGNGAWTVSTAVKIATENGLIETVTHRRHKGGMITHQVSWTGDPLRPTSVALIKTNYPD